MPRRRATSSPRLPARSTPGSSAEWLRLLIECLAAFQREQIGAEHAVVDTEIASSSGGGPENAAVWLICRSRAEKIAFLDTDFPRAVASIRRKLIDAGLPDQAVAALTIRPTSREEMR